MIFSILLVCSGNTCRSPLAEAILIDRLGDVPALSGIRVVSAGTGALDGAPASEGSYLVALERGLDLSSHRARRLTPELMEQADLILTMGRSHKQHLDAYAQQGKTFLLTEWAGLRASEISDPYGHDVTVYRETAAQLERLMESVVERLRTDLNS